MSDKTQDRLEGLIKSAKSVISEHAYGAIETRNRFLLRDLLATLEQQQAALQLAEGALEDLVEISVCSCSIGDEFRTDHHENCDWMKVQAALTAIKALKTE